MNTPRKALVLGTVLIGGIFSPPPAFAAPAADPRAAFLALIDRPSVPLAPQVRSIPSAGGMAEFHFSFASDSKQRVPGFLIKPVRVRGRLPVVIALHGTGGNKESQIDFLRQMAGRGFIGVAIDGRYAGERSRAGIGAADYQAAILRAWEGSGEHPFFYDTVWDVLRLVDYLQTRDDVDPRRIGLFGISKGGIETYLAAAVDPRIAVAVPCVGVESFRWALEHEAWQGRIGTIQSAFDAAARENGSPGDSAMVRRFYDRVVPGIYGRFDGPVMVPLIAPRPLLIINSDSDTHTPLAGVKECIAAVRQEYRRQGAEDRLVVKIQKKTGHHVNSDSLQQAKDWLTRWLASAKE